MNSSFCALILAAGKGTRMHSNTPKVLQPILCEPMLSYVRAALTPAFADNIWTVIGHGSDKVRETFSDAKFVEQPEQLGTGHALSCALPILKSAGMTRVLVVNGDMPLLTPDIVNTIIKDADGANVAATSILLDHAGSYGRIVRQNGQFIGIVEAKDYDESIFGTPTGEINAGVYVLDIEVIEQLLPHIGCNNKNGEYYITDLAALALKKGFNVRAVPCGREASLLGVNNPSELADAEEVIRSFIIKKWQSKGVHIHFPAQTVIGPHVTIEAGAQIFGPCHILGSSHIAAGVTIEAFCHIMNTSIKNGATIHPFCHFENAHIGSRAMVGPYTRLRIGTMLEEDSHVGNFVELKKTTLGKGAKANHLSYLGDAFIGSCTNIGAGTITCNYDGINKHKTIIGDHAFIGSNTALVAPVSVGDGALVGAGSTITKDIPDGTLAIARTKQISLPLRKKNNA